MIANRKKMIKIYMPKKFDVIDYDCVYEFI